MVKVKPTHLGNNVRMNFAKIGEVLDELEQIWIDSDFNLSHEELLQRLPELILQKSA